jgi:hypothetical protein
LGLDKRADLKRGVGHSFPRPAIAWFGGRGFEKGGYEKPSPAYYLKKTPLLFPV